MTTENEVSWFGLRSSEAHKARNASLYIAFIVAAFFTLKPARDAGFLAHVGFERLPYMYMGLGLLLAVMAAAVGRVLRGLPVGTAVTRLTLSALLLNALVWALSIPKPGAWFYWVLYLWVAALGLLLPLYAWLMFNEMFTVREARRVYWLIGLGGTAGAAVGALLAGVAAKHLGVSSLIPLALVHLSMALRVARLTERQFPDLWKFHSPPALQSLPDKESLVKRFLASRYLLWTLSAVFLAEFIATWIDYLFQSRVQQQWPSATDMAWFFSWFYFSTSVLSLLLQGFATRPLVEKLGLRWTLLILPLTLAVLSLGWIALPALAVLTMLRASDISLRNTLHKTSFELLYLPIPKELKEALRAPAEAVSVRSAAALAGAGILLFDRFADTGAAWRLAPLWTGMGLLLLVSIGLHAKYVDALKAGFRIAPKSGAAERHARIADPAMKARLTQALRSPDENIVLGALEFVEALNQRELLVPQFARHPSPKVRLKTLELSPFWGNQTILETAAPMLSDDAPSVRAEAIHLVCSLNSHEAARLVAPHLQSPDSLVRAEAAACLLRGGGEPGSAAMATLREMCASEDASARSAAAKVLGAQTDAETSGLLARLLEDEDLEVSVRAVESAGERASREHLPPLFRLLAKPRTQKHAQKALAKYRRRILSVLEDYLGDSTVTPDARRSIPSVLRRIGGPKAAALLTHTLESADAKLRYAALKNLPPQQNLWVNFGSGSLPNVW
ncbi:MAG: hypothetical protein COX66_19820 [Elusimicrobia bacterium CG_4_10_14_0_2_um_filter_63_34]|nr:MAG: hypothetical protein COX66_19820 [Elusimicrobia bacterium CG_4_10_14_0_2_um_filter_63_34]